MCLCGRKALQALMDQAAEKAAVGRKAAERVEAGMILGLGTGSTAACFVDAVAARGLKPQVVATSEATTAQARGHGFDVIDLERATRIDLTVDGVDEVTRSLDAIKGGGGALLQEKIVASLSASVVYIADSSKLVDGLGAFALPVEVSPFACAPIRRRLADLGAKPTLRLKDGAPFVSDEGHWIIDAAFGRIDDPGELDVLLNMTPGVVAHGLFVGMIDTMVIARGEDIETLERPE